MILLLSNLRLRKAASKSKLSVVIVDMQGMSTIKMCSSAQQGRLYLSILLPAAFEWQGNYCLYCKDRR